MARAALAHPLGLEDKPFALGVHDVQRRLLVVKALGQKLFDGVIDVFHVQRADLLPVPLDGALHGVGPGAHIIQIGPGDGQSSRHSPG